MALRSLVGLPNVTIEDPAAMGRAFELAGAGIDFADAIHLVGMGNADSFLTVDRKFALKARKLAPVAAL